MTNICFMNTNPAWGGGEKWRRDMALTARDRGYGVFAVAAPGLEQEDGLDREPGVQTLRLTIGNTSFLNPATLLRLAGFFTRRRIDHLVLSLPSDLKAGGLAGHVAGVPDIIYRRGIGIPTRNTVLNRFLYGRIITKLICNSEDTRRQVLKNNAGLIPPERVHILYGGLDLEALDAGEAQPLIPRRGSEVVVGAAGRLTEQKGHHLLLEAAQVLKDRGRDVRFVIAGKGELASELKARARELGVADAVEFAGFVTDMKRFLAGLDVFALPSLWEGFGFAQVEAMAMGLPVAAFDVSSIPEVVAHEETGLLAPAGDARALAEHLDRLVLDEKLRRGMGEAGRLRARERFELQSAFDGFERILASPVQD
jgi:glycosyltransferase involved in cell wall biosynthesis